jgi:hypothetical protein
MGMAVGVICSATAVMVVLQKGLIIDPPGNWAPHKEKGRSELRPSVVQRALINAC